ncbi:MAG: diguanylate cyclase, partial [Pseudomonadota bacterium]
MREGLFASFMDTLVRRPSPDDFRAVLQSGPLGAVITAVLSATFALIYGGLSDAPGIYGWAGATVLLSLFIYLRGRRASLRHVEYVSRSGAIRIVAYALVLATPWSALALMVLGRADPPEQMIALMICAGMSAGGAFALHRALLAALCYIGLVLASVVVAFLLRGHEEMWPVAVYALLYGVSLAAFSFLAARIGKDQEVSNLELSQLVDDLHAAHEEISLMAFVDPVTDLPNRSVFGRQVRELISEDGSGFAVLLLDLDGFKNVNDGIGYHAGDELLQIVSQRLRETVRLGDEVARLWADEFALVLKETDPQSILDRANEIINAVSEPTMIDGRAIYPNASVGGALFPRDGESENELIRRATIALHRAKETGRGRSLLYADAMSARIAEVDRL